MNRLLVALAALSIHSVAQAQRGQLTEIREERQYGASTSRYSFQNQNNYDLSCSITTTVNFEVNQRGQVETRSSTFSKSISLTPSASGFVNFDYGPFMASLSTSIRDVRITNEDYGQNCSEGKDLNVRLKRTINRGMLAAVVPSYPRSDDIDLLGVTDSEVLVWKQGTEKPEILIGSWLTGGRIHQASFSPTGDQLLISNSTTRDTGAELLTIDRSASTKCYLEDQNASWQAHRGSVTNSTFSPNGAYIATSGRDNLVKVWDAKNCALVKTIDQFRDGVENIRIDQAGGRNLLIVTTYRDGTYLFSLTDNQKYGPFYGNSPRTSLLSPDGKVLYIVELWGRIRIFKDWKNNSMDEESFEIGIENDRMAYSASFSRRLGSQYLLVGGNSDSFLLDLTQLDSNPNSVDSLKPVKKMGDGIQQGYVNIVGFSTDARNMVTGNGLYTRVWEFHTSTR